jgi:hypothetical protein
MANEDSASVEAIALAFLLSASGLSRRALMDIRAGRSRPHARNQECLSAIVRNDAGGGE